MPRTPRRHPRATLAALCLALALPLASCGSFSVDSPQAPPTDRDVSEMAPQSLKIPVTDFRWSYLPGNNHVQIQGTVINGEGRPVQGVIIALVLYDQNGVPVAVGDTYVSPTYLVAGGEGSFSVMALTSSKRMTHARLISNAQTRASY